MQWNDVSDNWGAYIPRVLTQWPELNETELAAMDGDQDKFLEHLADVKGGDQVAAQMELADWLIGGEPIDVLMDSARDNEQISASAQNMAEGEDALSDDAKFGDDASSEPPLAKAS